MSGSARSRYRAGIARALPPLFTVRWVHRTSWIELPRPLAEHSFQSGSEAIVLLRLASVNGFVTPQRTPIGCVYRGSSAAAPARRARLHAGGHHLLMSGDLYHYPEEITYKRVPSFDSDKEQTAQSRAMIEEFVRRTTANHGSRTIKPLGSTPWRQVCAR